MKNPRPYLPPVDPSLPISEWKVGTSNKVEAVPEELLAVMKRNSLALEEVMASLRESPGKRLVETSLDTGHGHVLKEGMPFDWCDEPHAIPGIPYRDNDAL